MLKIISGDIIENAKKYPHDTVILQFIQSMPKEI